MGVAFSTRISRRIRHFLAGLGKVWRLLTCESMALRLRFASTLVCCIGLITACAPPVSRPGDSPHAGPPGLGLQAEGKTRALRPQGPPRVIHHAPQGETDGQVELAIAFDRPMVELGTMRAAEGILQLEPRVPLTTRWLGSQTLLARPEHPLPMATDYRVSVHAGLRALDGKVLEGSFSYGFATPAPSIVRSEPGEAASHELPTRAIDLYFNQRVSPEQVKAHAALSMRSQEGVVQALAFEVSAPVAGDAKRVRVTPLKELPRGAHVTLRLDANLRGGEGPKPMGQPYQLSFEVFGSLHLVSNDACSDSGGRCAPNGGTLHFSNPVQVAAVRKALRFEPALKQPLADFGESYPSEYVYLGVSLQPGTSYQIKLVGDIVDVFGNSLEGERTINLKTGPYDPFLYFPMDGEVIPAGTRTSLPLRARNVPKLVMGMIALRPDEIEPLVSGRTWLPSRLLTNTVLKGAGPRDSRVLQLDTTPVIPSGKGVIVAYATQKPGDANAISARTVLAFTNLAPTLKTWPRGGLVWVTQLADSQPVAAAKVTIVDCGKTLARGKTDAQGSFRFTRPDSENECETFAIVEKDGDLSYARKYGGHGPWDLTSNTSYDGGGDVAGYLFTERGLYRPGERMRTKGVLQARTAKGFVPAQGKVKLKVTDSQGREIASDEVALNAFGTFSHEARIPGSVPLGTISVNATLGKDSFDAAAEVAEYRRAELEANVTPERLEYVRGETAQVGVHAQYLFGAPVSNQRVIWSARRTERQATPPGERYEGFSFGDETRWYEDTLPSEETTLSGGEGKLDAQGDLSLRIPLALTELEAGSSGVEIEATVEGLGGVTTSARTVLGVTPASFMLGIRSSTSLVEMGKPFQAEVVSAKLSGAATPNVAIHVSLTRRSYQNALTQGDAGEAVPVQTHTDELVASCSLKSAKAAVSCPLAAKAPGLHFLRVRAQDDKGRKVTAAIPIYVYGQGQASWGGEDSKILPLKADKKTYRQGEVARVLVPSPFSEAEAWITIERDGVMSVERRHISGGAPTLSIPIDERFVPNAFVSVLLMRGAHAATAQDDGRPDYRIGSVELQTDVSRRHLRVQVKPDAEDKAPGEEVSVSLQVRDGLGAPVAAELTVFAVDEGVLALSGYKTPDPFARLYAPQGLSVWTSDVRGRLVKEAESEDDKGGDEGGGGGAALRRDFESVAFYAPEVLTDAGGRAQIKFKLPDSLTRYRIMAVAVSRSAELGAGDATVRTHKPLMVRPMLPRVIRVGDTLEAGATIQTESEKVIEVEVSADVTGLDVEGPTKRLLKISKKQGAELRFKLRATHAGQARLRFSARSGKQHDAFEVTRAVLVPNTLETVSTTGFTDQATTEALGVLKDARNDVGGLALSLSTSALSALEAPVRALIDYQYGCTEQLSSRLIGMTALVRLAKLGVLEAGDVRAQAEKVLIAIERRQRSDGSFALWDDDRGTRYAPLDAFLTGYALFTLQQAEQAGFAPSKQARNDAKQWLAAYLRAEVQKPAELADADRVFVMYALARAGAADKSYAGTFLERKQKLSLISKVELAHTLLLAKEETAAEGLVKDILNRLRVTADEAHLEENLGDSYQSIMVSDVRATSELLLLLSAMDAQHPILPRLARWLSNARASQGDWGSTQENAWGLMALSAYLEATESTPPTFEALAQIDGEQVLRANLAGRKANAQAFVAMSDLPQSGARLDLSRKGQGRLHYTLRLSYAKQQLPTTPLEQGFFVEREYERVDPAALARGDRQGAAGQRAQVGDYVRVTLRVAVPATRRFVVIEDPLPAGLEPMSFGLATESQGAAQALGMEMGPLDHSEIRDDRMVFAVTQLDPGLYRYTYLARAVTAGHFVVPAARAEEMYHRETFGRTRAEQFDVVTR